jgi:hypothetical protein
MSIRCPICSKDNPDAQEFCSLCGTLLRNAAEPEPPKQLSPEDVDAMLAASAPVERGENLPVETRRVERGESLPVETRPAETGSRQTRPADSSRVERGENLLVETPLVERGESLPVETRPVETLPAPKATSRRWHPRCLGIGCLGILLLLLVGLPLLHFFVVRPPIERMLLEQIEDHIGQTFTIAIYSGPVQTVSVSQNRANTLLAPLWSESFALKDGQVTFDQDALHLETYWLFLPIEISGDFRVDGNGGLLVKSLALNWPARLLFTPESLSAAITRYVNDEILRPKNFFLLALQVTEGDLFLAYRAR